MEYFNLNWEEITAQQKKVAPTGFLEILVFVDVITTAKGHYPCSVSIGVLGPATMDATDRLC